MKYENLETIANEFTSKIDDSSIKTYLEWTISQNNYYLTGNIMITPEYFLYRKGKAVNYINSYNIIWCDLSLLHNVMNNNYYSYFKIMLDNQNVLTFKNTYYDDPFVVQDGFRNYYSSWVLMGSSFEIKNKLRNHFQDAVIEKNEKYLHREIK